MSRSIRDSIFDFVKEYTDTNGFSPSVREIGDAVGLTSPASVHSQLGMLAAEGRMKWTPGISRSYRVIEPAEAS
jgi:repressor LexA